MKQKKLIILCLMGWSFLGITGLQAQEGTHASGGEAAGSGGSVSYSVGQVFYHHYSATNGSETQGVQQPYEISIIVGKEDSRDISLMISTYPNPAADFLQLSVDNTDLGPLRYSLFDLNGKLLETKEIEHNLTNINLCNLTPSLYFLKVFEAGKEVKTFKIIKN